MRKWFSVDHLGFAKPKFYNLSMVVRNLFLICWLGVMMPTYKSLFKVRQADHKFNASLDFIVRPCRKCKNKLMLRENRSNLWKSFFLVQDQVNSVMFSFQSKVNIESKLTGRIACIFNLCERNNSLKSWFCKFMLKRKYWNRTLPVYKNQFRWQAQGFSKDFYCKCAKYEDKLEYKSFHCSLLSLPPTVFRLYSFNPVTKLIKITKLL